jgi:hypothetical protein
MPSVLKSGILGSHSEEVSFLLFRFLWTSKENERTEMWYFKGTGYLNGYWGCFLVRPMIDHLYKIRSNELKKEKKGREI